jgi:hypothetical protein
MHECICLYMYMFACLRVCMYTYLDRIYVHVHMFIHYVCMHACAWLGVLGCEFEDKHTYMHIFMSLYIFIAL